MGISRAYLVLVHAESASTWRLGKKRGNTAELGMKDGLRER